MPPAENVPIHRRRTHRGSRSCAARLCRYVAYDTRRRSGGIAAHADVHSDRSVSSDSFVNIVVNECVDTLGLVEVAVASAVAAPAAAPAAACAASGVAAAAAAAAAAAVAARAAAAAPAPAAVVAAAAAAVAASASAAAAAAAAAAAGAAVAAAAAPAVAAFASVISPSAGVSSNIEVPANVLGPREAGSFRFLNFSFLHCNIRGFLSHRALLEGQLRLLGELPAVICLNETFLEESTSNLGRLQSCG